MIFGPKPPPTNGAIDPDLPFAETKHAGKAVAHEHRRLGRIPDRQLTGPPVPLRNHTAGFDRRRRAVIVAETAAHDIGWPAWPPPR